MPTFEELLISLQGNLPVEKVALPEKVASTTKRTTEIPVQNPAKQERKLLEAKASHILNRLGEDKLLEWYEDLSARDQKLLNSSLKWWAQIEAAQKQRQKSR